MPVSKKDVRFCFERWFNVLPNLCAIESPWCFLCLSALIDYLANAAYPAPKKQRDRYVPFIEDFFPAKYRNFKYKNGQKDLPTQMYYVLRNGLVHSFSLFPDKPGRKFGRDRSIVLAHRSNAGGQFHLSNFSDRNVPDAALFVAEDFLDDTKKAAYNLLRQAKRGSILEQSILARFTAHPPIEWRP
jgi:hypothetical protein